MRQISVSNIVWTGEPYTSFLDLLAEEGAHGIEVAASLIWKEPVESTSKQRAEWRRLVESRGLVISGLHALLFARSDLQLLTNGNRRSQVVDYLKRTVDLCAELGGSYLVLGGPKNRRRGDLSAEEANRRGAYILNEIGNYAEQHHCCFVLEALPSPSCDFVTNLKECFEIVHLADTVGVQLHIDAGASSVTNSDTPDETLIEWGRCARHFHANDYDLVPPGSHTPQLHTRWAYLLNRANYSGWIGIEMRRTQEPTSTIQQAIRFVRSVYFE